MNPKSSKPLPGRRYKSGTTELFLILICFFPVFATFAQRVDTPVILKEIKVEKSSSKNAHKVIFGLASYYAQKFHGRQTANGEIFSHQKLTAACNVLPLGTWVQVTNLKNGKIIVVRTNDRLHPKTRRIIDLTYVGAKRLGFIKNGLTRVKIEILNQKLYKKPGKK